MKKNLVASVSLLLVAYLMGCSSPGGKTPSMTATSLLPLVAADTPSFTNAQKSTALPTLNSLQATSESYLATNWAPIYATLDSRAVKCDDGYQLEIPENIDEMSNDKWTIFTCTPKPKDFKAIRAVDYSKRYTKILKMDLSKSWIILHKDFSWSNRPGAYLCVRWWTPDGNYVYLVPAVSPGSSGGAPSGYFHSSNALYRLNLNSGKFEIILPHIAWGYSFLLSPDGKYLAYSIPDEKKVVHIRSMNTGTEQTITLNGDYILTGAFAWNMKSTKLFFASALNGWENGEAGITIFMLTLKNMYLQIILFNDSRFLIPFPQWGDRKLKYWMDENDLYVRAIKKSETVEYFSEFVLNVQSGNTFAITTPEPILIGSTTSNP